MHHTNKGLLKSQWGSNYMGECGMGINITKGMFEVMGYGDGWAQWVGKRHSQCTDT